MRTKILFPFFCFLLVFLASCNDSFLERTPTHDLNETTFWKTESDLKAFANGIYNDAGTNTNYTFMVGHHHDSYTGRSYDMMFFDGMSDNFSSTNANHTWAERISAGQEVVPSTNPNGGWHWVLLRKCNTLLANYNRAESVTQTIRNYYAGEALFFRAWFFLDKVQKYGDVPYFTIPLTDNSPELYAPRDPRKAVMDSVLLDINLACEYLPLDWGGELRVDKGTALALKSRICLYEGTYRKYHNLGDYQKFLEEAVKASEELIALNKYEIHSTGKPDQDYRTLFVSDDLSENKEMIFYRRYVTGLMGHRLCGYLTVAGHGATKDFVEDFLCKDSETSALPTSLSTIYSEETLTSEYDNRDPRLTQTIMDPRKAEDMFYGERAQLDYPRFSGMTGWTSLTGYYVTKFYDRDQDAKGFGNESHDAPLFRYAEVLLNLAEAKAELGTLTQSDLDRTVNLLRKRVNMPSLTMNPVHDPKYSKEIAEGLSPVLIEIRRERRVELSFEQLRYEDLMRWKKGTYLNKQVLGAKFKDEYFKLPEFEKVLIKTTTDGYIDALAGSDFRSREFDEKKNYLRPLPLAVLASNDNFEQNPNWE